MRKFILVFIALFFCIDVVNAAVRGQSNTQNISTASMRSTTTNIKPRQTTQNQTKRSNVSSRAATTSSARTITARSATTKTASKHQGNTSKNSRQAQSRAALSRASVNKDIATNTFNKNYTGCRDAYFTCMDQFCAIQNDNYRRCACSSRLTNIINQEKALSQTADSLADFENLNIEMIPKTAEEVKAMLSASEGETAIKNDSSTSSSVLKNISNILNNSKKQSLSTQGQLDIAGNIKSVWSTTDLIVGADIANLSGEALFNAVHTQCSELVEPSCNETDFKMVASSYGMYIENDCAILEANLNKKTIAANMDIRTTRHKMQDTRLENYDAHNSATINDCIANVRQNILSDSVCGENYVHCLDFSGKFINITTGKPIYSSDFYKLENQISLEGDILSNSKNSVYINELNNKRNFATKNLDLCRDNADKVWNEFLRQALVEIYQAQQKRVKDVKEECLQVVNDCYTNKSETLKSMITNKTLTNTALTLETAEALCQDKLTTCSNLYGGGPDGLDLLIATMKNITDTTIEQSCVALLTDYAKNICSVPASDTTHSYPYGCRKYNPGEARFARKEICNSQTVNPFARSDVLTTHTNPLVAADYTQWCQEKGYVKQYISCKFNFYLDKTKQCKQCEAGNFCPGGTSEPISLTGSNTDTINDKRKEIYDQCGSYYVGSLYQQLAIFALQNCTRTSNQGTLSESIISDIDVIMNNVRASLIQTLAAECNSYKGTWVNAPWIDADADGYHDDTDDTLKQQFYISTGTNELWGYCKN